MPPSSKRQRQPQVANTDETTVTSWLFKVEETYPPHRILVTKPDNSCKRFRDYSRAAFYVNMSRRDFRKKLEENRFTEFLVWPNDTSKCFNMCRGAFTPGVIVEFTTSRGSSRPYPVEVSWGTGEDTPRYLKWHSSMGKAERSIGAYKGFISEHSKRNHGKPFKMRVTPWMELEPYDESLTESMQINETPTRGELELGTDPETGALVVFIENPLELTERCSIWFLLPHKYAMVKGQPENGQTPFMVLNTTAGRCRMYKCKEEVISDMRIYKEAFERALESCNDDGVIWWDASSINSSRIRPSRSNPPPKKMAFKSPVRKYYVDPKVMIYEYQTESLAESNFHRVAGTPGKTFVEPKVEPVDFDLEIDSEVDSEFEISDVEYEPEVETGEPSVFIEDLRRSQIHGLYKYLLPKHRYVIVEGTQQENGETPYMVLNTTVSRCRMYECASELAADMRITEKELERHLLSCDDRGELRLDATGINFSRVRGNWEFDDQKREGIQSPIRKYYHHVSKMAKKFQANSLRENDFQSI